jgi:hypothetical protein
MNNYSPTLNNHTSKFYDYNPKKNIRLIKLSEIVDNTSNTICTNLVMKHVKIITTEIIPTNEIVSLSEIYYKHNYKKCMIDMTKEKFNLDWLINECFPREFFCSDICYKIKSDETILIPYGTLLMFNTPFINKLRHNLQFSNKIHIFLMGKLRVNRNKSIVKNIPTDILEMIITYVLAEN